MTAQPQLELSLDAGYDDLQDAFNSLTWSDSGAWETHVLNKAVEYLANKGRDFSSDDLRLLDNLPPVHPNRIGQAFNAAVRRGQIVEVGRVPSKIRSNHGRKVSVYRRADLTLTT